MVHVLRPCQGKPDLDRLGPLQAFIDIPSSELTPDIRNSAMPAPPVNIGPMACFIGIKNAGLITNIPEFRHSWPPSIHQPINFERKAK